MRYSVSFYPSFAHHSILTLRRPLVIRLSSPARCLSLYSSVTLLRLVHCHYPLYHHTPYIHPLTHNVHASYIWIPAHPIATRYRTHKFVKSSFRVLSSAVDIVCPHLPLAISHYPITPLTTLVFTLYIMPPGLPVTPAHTYLGTESDP